MTGKNKKPKPHYPLADIKRRIKAGDIKIRRNAAQTAWNDFRWRAEDIKKCLLKLNDRYHNDDPEKNHFYKTEPYRGFPNTMMDYYKAKNVMYSENVYTHFYIDPESIEVIVNSFKAL